MQENELAAKELADFKDHMVSCGKGEKQHKYHSPFSHPMLAAATNLVASCLDQVLFFFKIIIYRILKWYLSITKKCVFHFQCSKLKYSVNVKYY